MFQEIKERIRPSLNVFISYSHNQEDEQLVSKLSLDLQRAGLHVWMDREQIKLGDNWEKSIQKALHKAKSIIVVLSPDSVRSVWIKQEVEEGLRKNKQIFPLVLTGGESSLDALHLDSFKTFDVSESYQGAVDELARVILQK